MIHDGLWDPYGACHMGNYAELCAETHNFTKDMQDAHADESYRRARAASFSDEVTPVTVKSRKGETVVSTDDEIATAPKPASGAKPAFKKEGGTVTAANASTISDGAAAVVLMSRKAADENGIAVLATVRGFGDAEQEPQWFTTAPAAAIPRALIDAGLEGVSDVDYFEINEAFSVVSLANNKLLQLDPSKVRARASRHTLRPAASAPLQALSRILAPLPPTEPR
jgi:acetyl-CoA C-acetyltransferase